MPATLAILSVLVASAQSVVAPLLTVTSISPRDEQRTGCSVVLTNPHNRPAVGWIIETLPYRDTGTTSDNVLAPPSRIAPGRSQTLLFPCNTGELPALEVVATIYDDNSIAGDHRTLSKTIIRTRLAKAAGLEELDQLLRYAGAARRADGPPQQQVADLISQSVGPRIDNQVRQEALSTLSRIKENPSEPASQRFASLTASLRDELKQAISALRAVSLQEDK